MATPDEMTIKQALATLVLRWDGDDLDWESERRAVIEVTNGVGELWLPRGKQGEDGDQGDPGPGLAPDLVVTYATDELALASLPGGLTPSQRGYCVVNNTTKTAFFWSGNSWLAVTNAVGLKGDNGVAVSVSVGTVTTTASGSAASVSLDPASTTTNRIFNFSLPRGTQGTPGVGLQGPAGNALNGAGDVLWPVGGPTDGQVLIWDTDIGKATFGAAISGSTGPWTAGPNETTAINDSAWPADYKQVCKVDIPAQPFAWHPRVSGVLDVRVSGAANRVDLEARLNSAGGPICGRGPGSGLAGEFDNFIPRTLIPAFEALQSPTSVGTSVAKGEAASIYFSIRRIDTLAVFGVATRKDRASFTVYCDPIPGSA